VLRRPRLREHLAPVARLRQVRVLVCHCVRKVRVRRVHRVRWVRRRERHVPAVVRRRVARDFRSVPAVLHSRVNSVRERRKVRVLVVRNNFVRVPERKAARWVRRVKVVPVRRRLVSLLVQGVVAVVLAGATIKLL
jgi:hypothetical protein